MSSLREFLGWIKRIIKFPITNKGEGFSLERITSDAFLFSAALVSLVSCIFNFIEGFNLTLTIFTVFSSVLLSSLYYFSRFRNKYNIWLSASIVLLLLSVSWFMNSGALGSVPYIYLCTVLILNFIARREQQNGLFIMVLINITALYCLEYFFGEKLISPYPNKSVYFFDMVFVFLIILICVFISTRFIKRSYENERDLVRERTRELELSNEKRTNVFINLAHETKTPLTLIINYLDDYIKRNNKQDDEELKLLKSAVDNLTKDIVNFFDMEKIQKGFNMYNHNQLTDFSTLVNNNIRLFNTFAQKKQIGISSLISESVFIKSDPSAVVRIINNLIENAIKYTPDGGRIEIGLEVNKDRILFFVKDNGIGIPLSHQGKIFEPYFQVNSQKANYQGVGLGLSIVKKIVEELNGTIEIGSDPESGPGTKITVTFPYHTKEQNEVAVCESTANISLKLDHLRIVEQPFDADLCTIMIVEDDISLLNYLVTSLQTDYNIIYAQNGKEAVEKLKSVKQLDLVISDVMMDDGDGFFLFDYMLSSKRLNHLPFIFLTAKFSNSDRLKGLSMGSIDYISKPVSIDELNRKINSILKNMMHQRNAIIANAYYSLIQTKDCMIDMQVDKKKSNMIKFNLTPREIEIVHLMAEGKINKEIANVLFISVDTVKKHVQNIYDKTDVTNKLELLRKITA